MLLKLFILLRYSVIKVDEELAEVNCFNWLKKELNSGLCEKTLIFFKE